MRLVCWNEKIPDSPSFHLSWLLVRQTISVWYGYRSWNWGWSRSETYLTGLDESTIGEILPRRAEITAPFDNIDFGIVQEVSIWAVSTTDSELRKEIFYQDRINLNDQKELRLFSSLSEVKDILLNDHVDLEVRFKFRAFTPTQIETRLIMNFLVNGKMKDLN